MDFQWFSTFLKARAIGLIYNFQSTNIYIYTLGFMELINHFENWGFGYMFILSLTNIDDWDTRLDLHN